MNSSSSQVFDLLLGGLPKAGKAAAPGLTQAGDDLFTRLFGQMLSVDGQPESLITSLGNKNSGSFDLLGLTQVDESSKELILNSEPVENRLASLLGNISLNDGAVVDLPLSAAFMPLIKNSEIATSDLSQLQGKFDIIDAEVKGDRVTLTLASKDSTESESNIKLNISVKALEQLLQANLNNQPGSSRVQLDGINQQISNLESVLKEVDLKEIKLELDVDKTSQKANPLSNEAKNNNGLKISLLVEESGQMQAIKGKLQKSEISVERVGKQPVAEPILLTEKYFSDNKPENLTAGLMRMSHGQQLVEKNSTNGFNQSTLDSSFMTDEFFTQNSSKGINSLSAEQMTDTAADNRMSAALRPTRFVFPEQAAMTLRPNGQSITLTIEPEHLGTARLRLVMHDNNLIARVVVDTVQAKAALESGLDRLADQLSQANIKVESIEVSVGGDDAQRGQFDQMAFWQKRNRIASLLNSEEENNVPIIAQAASFRPSAGYLRADGINMLA